MSGKHWIEDVLVDLEDFAKKQSMERTQESLMDARMVFLNEVRQKKAKINCETGSIGSSSSDPL